MFVGKHSNKTRIFPLPKPIIMVQIANPIYDVVFKYLMNDDKIARLLHDSIIIQIPYLKGRRRTELEQLLALFDQSSATDDPHLLNVNEDDLPERYRPMIRRLQKAIADPVVRQTMEAEDDLIEEFKDYQRLISAKESIIVEKEKVISEKEKTISEKEKTIGEKQRQLESAIRELYVAGTDVERLAGIFRLTIDEIKELLDKENR